MENILVRSIEDIRKEIKEVNKISSITLFLDLRTYKEISSELVNYFPNFRIEKKIKSTVSNSYIKNADDLSFGQTFIELTLPSYNDVKRTNRILKDIKKSYKN